MSEPAATALEDMHSSAAAVCPDVSMSARIAAMTITTYTRQQVADMLQISLTTVGTLITEKQLYSVRVGRSIRVPDWALDDYLHGRPAYGPADPLAEMDHHPHYPTESILDEGADGGTV